MLKQLGKILWVVFFLLTVGTACSAASIKDLKVVASGNERYIALQDLASLYGLSVAVPFRRTIQMRNKWTRLEFETDGRQAWLNGTLIWLHAPVTKVRGRWSITENDTRKVLDPLVRPSAYLGNRGARTVVLDPGHGGEDRGAMGKRGVEEKRAVLDICKRIRICLANEGLRVYITREVDRQIPLEDRPRKAAILGADLFVSVHLNSALSGAPSGVETYVLTVPGYPSTADASNRRVFETYGANRFDHSSTYLGYSIQKALVQKTGAADRGLRRARFMVLKKAACPAVLVEAGFLSNSREEMLLAGESYRETVARGIAQGIIGYVYTVKKAQAAAP